MLYLGMRGGSRSVDQTRTASRITRGPGEPTSREGLPTRLGISGWLGINLRSVRIRDHSKPLLALLFRQGQREPHARPLARRAVDADGAAVRLDDGLHNRQTQPAAARRQIARRISAIE